MHKSKAKAHRENAERFCFTDIKVWHVAVPLLLPLSSLRKVQFFFAYFIFSEKDIVLFLPTLFFSEKGIVLFLPTFFLTRKKVRFLLTFLLQEKSKSVFCEEKNHIAA